MHVEGNVNSLRQLEQLGQSVWLDYIRRDLITGGKLKRLIDEDGLSGITSNPTTFSKALSGDGEYDSAIQDILRDSPDLDSRELFERIELKICKWPRTNFAPFTIVPMAMTASSASKFLHI